MTNFATGLALGYRSPGGCLAQRSGRTRLPRKTPRRTARFDVQGFHVRVDLSGQVIGVDVPDDRGFAGETAVPAKKRRCFPRFAATGGFVSASVLAQKAKQFDDGLYAAVEDAAQNGAGSFAGKASDAQASSLACSPAEQIARMTPDWCCSLPASWGTYPSTFRGTLECAGPISGQ